MFLALLTWFALHDSPVRKRHHHIDVAEAEAVEADGGPPQLLQTEKPKGSPAGAASSQEKAKPAQRRVVGHVNSDAPGALPIQGAMVVLKLVPPGGDTSKPAVRQCATDAEGAYILLETRGAAVSMEVTAAGYEPRVLDRPILDEGPVAQVDVKLTPTAGIHGVVLSPEGPAPDTILGLWAPGARTVGAVAQSDPEGRFEMSLPDIEGPFTLKARHQAHGEASIEIRGPGEVVVHLPGGGYFEGHVVDSTGEAVQAFAVAAEPQGRRMLATSVAQSFDSGDGAFRVGPVAAGTFNLRAAAEGFQPGEPVSAVAQAGQTTSDITIVMKASGRLSGRVTDAVTRRPVEDALIVPAEWAEGDLAESVGAHTDADGRYSLKALPGKRSSLTVSAEGYLTLLGGGVEVASGKSVVRDFALNPQRKDQMPSSELTGIGAVLAPRPDGVAIAQIVDGGPAARLLNEGDVVVSVDGKATAGMPLPDVANAIRGELGTDVTLMVKRGGAGAPERVVVRRDRVTMPDRNHMPGGHGPHGPGGPEGVPNPHVPPPQDEPN